MLVTSGNTALCPEPWSSPNTGQRFLKSTKHLDCTGGKESLRLLNLDIKNDKLAQPTGHKVIYVNSSFYRKRHEAQAFWVPSALTGEPRIENFLLSHDKRDREGKVKEEEKMVRLGKLVLIIHSVFVFRIWECFSINYSWRKKAKTTSDAVGHLIGPFREEPFPGSSTVHWN